VSGHWFVSLSRASPAEYGTASPAEYGMASPAEYGMASPAEYGMASPASPQTGAPKSPHRGSDTFGRGLVYMYSCGFARHCVLYGTGLNSRHSTQVSLSRGPYTHDPGSCTAVSTPPSSADLTAVALSMSAPGRAFRLLFVGSACVAGQVTRGSRGVTVHAISCVSVES